MLLPSHPSSLAPLRASSSSSGAHLRLPFPSCPSPAPLISRSPLPRWPPPLRAHASGAPVRRRSVFGLDALLSAAELLCLAPPAICSVVCAARLVFSSGSASAGPPPPLGGGRLFVLQYVLLVGAVAIGSLIRRRQSERLRPAGGAAEGVGVGSVERMEKVEESVRSMVAAVGVLSRTVEKLGVRFRVLRRTLRAPISELLETPVRRRGVFGLDALLSAAELLCLAPPAICSVVCAARLVFSSGSASAGPPPPLGGGRLFVLQYVLLVGAVAIGSLLRRRQSERLRPAGGAAEGVGVGSVERMEKVEESVRSMVAAVGVLSRTVEKLGVRFRVLRRTLRDPISETAALAQKNSEATRILAAQEVLLEKEIGAIQKMLYAMQEQQQKQLDLILAIGEASTILDGEQDMVDQDRARSSSANPDPEIENKQAKISSGAVKGGNNKP